MNENHSKKVEKIERKRRRKKKVQRRSRPKDARRQPTGAEKTHSTQCSPSHWSAGQKPDGGGAYPLQAPPLISLCSLLGPRQRRTAVSGSPAVCDSTVKRTAPCPPHLHIICIWDSLRNHLNLKIVTVILVRLPIHCVSASFLSNSYSHSFAYHLHTRPGFFFFFS